MNTAQERPPEPDLDTYLRLFTPYEQPLKDFSGREGEYGARFALLFRQTLRLLSTPSSFNERIPRTFLAVTDKYLSNEYEAVRHFSYEENRHFFLADLLDWLNRHERGRKLRNMQR